VYAILNSMAIDSFEDVYVLGSFANHVTIHSQQRRAFNLIWALFKSGRLKEGSSVTVIGGGFAGLTAAAAAQQRGAGVTLFEKEFALLNLQIGNHTRYLHPNLYDWPQPGSEDESTALPFLNWRAGPSSSVSKTVKAEWESLFADKTT
jgi:FAD dependent oxidoreductase